MTVVQKLTACSVTGVGTVTTTGPKPAMALNRHSGSCARCVNLSQPKTFYFFKTAYNNKTCEQFTDIMQQAALYEMYDNI